MINNITNFIKSYPLINGIVITSMAHVSVWVIFFGSNRLFGINDLLGLAAFIFLMNQFYHVYVIYNAGKYRIIVTIYWISTWVFYNWIFWRAFLTPSQLFD